jgi:cytochrome c oxidase subunit II
MDAIIGRRALLGAAGALALGSWAAFALAQPRERVIKIVARKFSFSPAEIQLKKGEPVVLEFTTLDVMMGFKATDFGVRTDIVPGQTSRLRITPDKAGHFAFNCDVFCGSGHEDMGGTLIVSG